MSRPRDPYQPSPPLPLPVVLMQNRTRPAAEGAVLAEHTRVSSMYAFTI